MIRYDGLGRVIRTDLPNGTYSSVTRTPWLETASDPNDNVLDSAWRTTTLALPPGHPDRRALTLTEAHAATPTETHLDALGRAFLVVANNNLGADADAKRFKTRTTLDIEGQVLEVKDPTGTTGRICQTHVYSMAGKLLRETNIDKGTRWHFHDATGALLRKWDDRGQRFRPTFDVLRRPTHLHMKPGTAAEVLLQRTVYGDSPGTGIADPKVGNLRGKPIRVFDGAGQIKSQSYDFKGNSLSSERKLATTYTTVPDWTTLSSVNDLATLDATPLLEATPPFTESRTFDALNRVVSATAPDGSIFLPTYNEAGLLEKVDVRIRGVVTVTPFVANINYDAKGQRKDITYSAGNFRTDYTYDPLTFRLKRVLTTRISPAQTLQDLNYTFDPVGNIVEVIDNAQDSLFFGANLVSPSALYEYDAVYRLIRGEGREHNSNGDTQMDFNDQPIRNLPHPNDPASVRRYFETYTYDKVGNILQMFHSSGPNTWTRNYTYNSSVNNRLVSHNNHGGGTVSFLHDAHGSMLTMPHLSGGITWTPFDQMRSASNSTQTTYFTYGASGDRVRKVYVDPGTNSTKERIYLGSYEVYREKTSGVTQLERQTLHVMDGAKRLAMVETKTIQGGLAVTPLMSMFRYQLGNHLGSAILETNEVGLVISYEEYTPYGTSAYRSSRSGVDVSTRRYRYVGLERDDETGLYAMGARYYAAWLGRWTSADPLGIGADGPGVYNYTRGSPVVLVDPGGMETRESDACAEVTEHDWIVAEETTSKDQNNQVKAAVKAKADARFRTRYAEVLEPRWVAVDPQVPEPDPTQGEGGAPAWLDPYAPYAGAEGGPTVEGEGMMATPSEAAAWKYMALTVATAGTPQLAAFIGTATTVSTEGDLPLAVMGQLVGLGVGSAQADDAVAFPKSSVGADDGLNAPKGARGSWGGRTFDDEAAGGPVRELSTEGVRVTDQGIDVVEGHLARFGPDAANEGMVGRLRAIAAGDMEATAADLNFYTHELREYVRYRRLGFRTGTGADYELWNNAHSATLADYSLVEGPGALYHPSVVP